ncbi:MAG: hypothetical protein WD355_06550 [Balneolaceae bacterium]
MNPIQLPDIKLSIGSFDLNVKENFALFVVKPLFLLFLYYSMFSRYSGFFGLTGGMTAALISGVLFVLAAGHLLFLSDRIEISRLALFITVFFILVALTPLASSYVFDGRPAVALRYSIEVAIAFFIFFSFYYFLKSGIITPKFLIYAFAYLGLLSALQLITTIIGEVRIGRLRGLGALNYIANSFAVSGMAWIIIIYKDYVYETVNRWRVAGKFICFTLIFIVMLFTGTRGATVAFLVGIFFLQVLGMQSKRFTKYSLMGTLGLALALLIIALNIDISIIWNRYSYEDLSYMVDKRLGIYLDSVIDLSFVEFLFGRPDLYTFEDGLLSDTRYINTHNVFLSLVRYNGLIPFFLFSLLLLIILLKYGALYFAHRNDDYFRLTESTIIVFFVVVMILALISGGRSTRLFSMYIMIAYAVGYLELVGRVGSMKEYKKMIM